jgi:Zn finger protein HypA/HybF involved in hydrogenase expression
MAAVTAAVMAGTCAAVSSAYAGQPKGKPAPPKESPSTITKCPSCGSRDFKVHAGERICSYCRSEA